MEEDDAYYYAIDNNGNKIDDSILMFEYKIEDEVFKIKPKNSSEEFQNYGSLKNGKLTVTAGLSDGSAVVFEKN